ncbi:MAG: hypothetical protein ACOYD7_03365 [Raoultibacter sp.]|jgi:hypothetical protein
MSSVGKSINSTKSTRTKFLAVFMSVLLVLTMFNISAFATGDGAVEEETTTGTEAGVEATVGGGQQSPAGVVTQQTPAPVAEPVQTPTLPSSYAVTFDVKDSCVEIGEDPANRQELSGTTVNVPVNKDLVFTATPNTNYIDTVVTVTSGGNQVPYVKEGDTYTIASSYITSDSIKVEVVSSADPNASGESSAAQPINGNQVEVVGQEITPNNFNIMGAPLAPASSSIINGSIDLLYEPSATNPSPDNGNIIHDSGNSITAKLDLELIGAAGETFIIAVPVANDGASVGFTVVQGVSHGVVDSSLLPSLDQSYSKYAVAVITKNNASTIHQLLTATFAYPSLTTAAGSSQPVIGYLLKGTDVAPEGSTDSGILGLGRWVDTSFDSGMTP